MKLLPEWAWELKLVGNGKNAYWTIPLSTAAKGDEIRISCREGVTRTFYVTSLWVDGRRTKYGQSCDETGVIDSTNWLVYKYKIEFKR